MSVFFSCFSGSSKVLDGGNEKNEKTGVSRKARNVDGDKGKRRQSAPIPVAYFPIGSNFSHL